MSTIDFENIKARTRKSLITFYYDKSTHLKNLRAQERFRVGLKSSCLKQHDSPKVLFRFHLEKVSWEHSSSKQFYEFRLFLPRNNFSKLVNLLSTLTDRRKLVE